MVSSKVHIISLQKDFLDFEKNLTFLKNIILKKNKTHTIIAAPELYLSGFDYANISLAAQRSADAIKELLEITEEVVVVLSVIAETQKGFLNQAIVINQHRIIHKQNKSKLFKLGEEHKYFMAGDSREIILFEVWGVKLGLLICFELRFKELWQKVEGADIVLVIAKWGAPRAHHLEILASALGVMNQCFVTVTSIGDESIAKTSMIVFPNGDMIKESEDEYMTGEINIKDVVKMRRYIDMGEKG